VTFTADQNKSLAAPLLASNVKTRKQANRQLSYIEGWKAIEEANRIFGFDAWTRETTETRLVAERERGIGEQQVAGWGVSYIAKVRIIVFAGDQLVTREGVGAGHGIDRDLGQAHESAIKEAETDAMKRALMTFGYPFGLALYDKQQEHVADEAPKSPTTRTTTKHHVPEGAKAVDWCAEIINRIEQCATADSLDVYVNSPAAADAYKKLAPTEQKRVLQAKNAQYLKFGVKAA
jgi:DNA recombination protein Rad52